MTGWFQVTKPPMRKAPGYVACVNVAQIADVRFFDDGAAKLRTTGGAEYTLSESDTNDLMLALPFLRGARGRVFKEAGQ